MDINNMQLPSNRKFGLFFTLVFILATIYFYIKFNSNASTVFLVLSLLMFFVTIVKDDLLLPLNKLWMEIGIMIGKIVSPVLMAIIFFGMFMPLSIVMRIFGRDELRLNMKYRKSYWKEKVSVNPISESFKNQF
tara:strand:- start:3692 stop:4093 length:402 start_codon:yes stop_codon:yes gene_type:complete